jgi:hypothetical protein
MVTGKNICSGTAPSAACGFDKCRDSHGNPKENVCVANRATCAGDVLVSCVADTDGCAIAARTDCTTVTNMNTCRATSTSASCVNDPCHGLTNKCQPAGLSCQGTTLVSCSANSDSCLVKHPTDCTQGGTVKQTCGGSTPACVACTDDTVCAGKSQGDTVCDGNVFVTCADTDGDQCLNARREDCGSSYTCNAPGGCVYSGAACRSSTTDVLKHAGSYGPYNTTGTGNDYAGYSNA